MITSKRQMYDLLHSGALGQTLKAASTWQEACELLSGMDADGRCHPPGPDARWAIRYKTAGHKTQFHLTKSEATQIVRTLPDGSYSLSTMILDENRVMYGHLLDTVGGWHLTYSRDPKPCKLMPSLDGCTIQYARGLHARVLLRELMDDAGWRNLRRLLGEYPDHVVEFTILNSSRCGFGPSNTIFWEVRCTTDAYEWNSGWGNRYLWASQRRDG